ncbi:MAG: diaminopimelate epimerase [Firmicutes bacterium]|nr:diaminopimelate epimerase [Bacillota bacterium]
MDFYKYQGAGNDFVITDNMDLTLGEKSKIAAEVCDRRFGVGADGFIAAEPSETSDVKMAFYNADGSEAGMCGNGIRCFSKFVFDMGIVDKSEFTVETGDGEKHINIINSSELVTEVKVDMGFYNEITQIMCSIDDGGVIAGYQTEKNAENDSFEAFVTHLGVPHAVVFADNAGDGMNTLNTLAEKFGHDIEYSEKFAPARTNVNFVKIIDKEHILCSTWERGAGKTLACGTGACSSAAAAYLNRGCGDAINVKMPGGEVTVSFGKDCTVFMQGTAVLTFKGSVLG